MLEAGPPIMQVSFVEEFNRLQSWEQTMILSSLQRLVALMNAETLDAAPILATDSTLSPTEAPISGYSMEQPMEIANGKDRR